MSEWSKTGWKISTIWANIAQVCCCIWCHNKFACINLNFHNPEISIVNHHRNIFQLILHLHDQCCSYTHALLLTYLNKLLDLNDQIEMRDHRIMQWDKLFNLTSILKKKTIPSVFNLLHTRFLSMIMSYASYIYEVDSTVTIYIMLTILQLTQTTYQWLENC